MHCDRRARGVIDSFLLRAGWQPGEALGAKLVTLFPANSGKGLATVHGVFVLFDGDTGRPTAVVDGTELTYWKTAADSALGASLVGPPEPRTLLMVGAGSMAPHLIRAHCALAPSIARVLVWNRTAERARALCASAPAPGVEHLHVEGLAEAAAAADLICCATMTTEPLIRGGWLRGGQHLDLVGAFTPQMREVDDAAVRRARVFVDARETTVAIGEIALAVASGALAADGIEADLFDLCASPGRPAPAKQRAADDVTLFKNGGGGHLDLITARYFLDACG